MADWVQSFEEYAQKLLAEAKVTGTAVGLAEQGELKYFHGFGLADNTEDAKALTADTVFGIGSVTKSFTCVAIMQLQDAGKLSVHDPVIKYLPELRTPNEAYTREITIHHLMTHTAGFPPLDTLMGAMKRSIVEGGDVLSSSSGLDIDLDRAEEINTKEEFMAYIGKLDYEFLGAPGTEFSYSNDSYAMLGLIIERVSGISYEQFVQDHILVPAGMKNSAFLVEDLPEGAEVATLFTRKSPKDGGEVYRSPSWWDSPSMRAAGFLKSTIHDLLRYTEIFRTGGLVGENRLLSPESVQAMMAPHCSISPFQAYGYGLFVANCHGGTLIEHGGAIKGVAAQIFVLPERNLTGAILMNTDGGPMADLMHGILNASNGRSTDTVPFEYPDYELAVEALPAFTGEYRSSEGATVSVEIEENELVAKSNGTNIPLRSVGEDSFVMKRGETDMFIHFVRDEAGVVTRMGFGARQLIKVLAEKEQTV
ncbi:serine hydrolase domain-containing protein [Brevibacillus brevis]|uniref:serine hydrolase domain-containing protein n=1 Tax=Brevibacillus brevis TaxID=1393 RepID=UPI000D0F302F|nr:serine hydrolase domain-containing protein [Brevibacillus brevis]PSJ68988.1 penicillin-binding protein [Brevibacillus brevis]RED29549.1 CubicO group peptidase (beta-lactamase class C family) [Brevibacillus brevis]GEC92706.1 serine hydrolase [Brevibacillus brevis]VEF88151.1 Esterase estB [Brevibacillus brevis]